MNDREKARLNALLEAHEAIAHDIGVNEAMGQDKLHMVGEREGLLRVEELIAGMVEENDRSWKQERIRDAIEEHGH